MSAQLQRLLFVMPDDDETYIAAMAAVSAYVGKLTGAGIRTDVNLVGPETWLSSLLVPPAFRMFESVDAAGGGYDLAVELTQERAAQLANATSQSCATGFGTLLGFEGVSELVRINGLSEPEHDIGVLWWGLSADKFCESVQRGGTDVVLVHDGELCVDALNCYLLVGRRSPLTYLAACAGRAVIELYPTDEYEKSFFAKWSCNRYYCMLLETRQAIEAPQNYATLWRSFERIWGQLGARRRRVLQPAAADATP